MTAQAYLLVFAVVSILTIGFAISALRKVSREYAQVEIKLDVNLRQMQQSEARVAEFYRQYQLSPDVSTIRDVGWALKIIESEETDDSIKDKARLSEPDADGYCTVFYRSGLTETERTFSFAHECGHIINGDSPPATHPDGHDKPEVEQLADYTGGALLMPLESVRKYLVESDYARSGQMKRASIIYALCEKYGVDRTTALRRVKEVCILKGIA